MRRSFLLALVIAVAGCAPEPVPFDEVADVQQLMLTVIEPAAEVYWESVATIMTLEGTEEIAPKTFAEWQAVRNAAMTVAESGNLLLTPGRRQEGANWIRLSRALIAAGREALLAAEARDPDAVFEAGGEIYLICAECHTAFAPDALRSSFGQED
jgi:hypothetical protein